MRKQRTMDVRGKSIPNKGIIQSKSCSFGMFEDRKAQSDQSRWREESGQLLGSMVRVDFWA